MAETQNLNPASQVQHLASEWSKIVAAQVTNVEAVLAESAKLEAKGIAQATAAWDEAGRYAKEAFALAEKAGAEWRKLILEATKRAAQVVTPAK